eukprot:CAMPEP_0197522282 /NCGR_PEP_ID=MMETSP1318-20131121/7459_1 /TAXON_ID=552666 /ORGANISM="Partenskyella glossopodia, Strain RCC365" /LENGTH=230 /DNA_ID=CAMNT_0043074611 /DNA_START=77 /DNA_END=766 /DNA_ORIENTATION=+
MARFKFGVFGCFCGLVLGLGSLGTTEALASAECEMYSVASDMDEAQKQEIMAIFLNEAPEDPAHISRTRSKDVSDKIGERFGGFWNTFILGPKFSFSVNCVNYVQLSTSTIEVLICKESNEPFGRHGIDCGTGVFKPTRNDTIPHNLALHDNMRLDIKRYLDDENFYKLAGLIQGSDFDQPVAESIRSKVEANFPGIWNVVVDEEKSARFQSYWYDHAEMLSLETNDRRW